MDLQHVHRLEAEDQSQRTVRRKNGKLAQLYLFFHPQDSLQPLPSKVCSLGLLCKKPGPKQEIAAERVAGNLKYHLLGSAGAKQCENKLKNFLGTDLLSEACFFQ